MNKNILITLKKELRSIFRDKKTITRLLLFPLIIPVIIIIYGEIFNSLENDVTKYNIGLNYEVGEVEKNFIESNNLIINNYNNIDDLKEAFNKKVIDGYITYDSNNKTYTIYVDESSNIGLTVSSYLTNYLESYSTYLTNNYLLKEGINLDEAYNNFNISYEQLSSKNYILSLIISLSITYIIMSIVLSSGNMATGATATERENGTLETILTFPIKKSELIIGKYLSCATIGIISSLIAFILMIIGILFAESHYTMFESTKLIVNFPTIISSVITIIVASLFISGIAIMLCGMSKSYKEAQSSVSFLNMLTIIPLFLSMSEANIKTIYYLIPIFNHEQIIMDVFNNNFIMSNFLLTIISSIVYIIILIYLVIRAYNNEKVLFTN